MYKEELHKNQCHKDIRNVSRHCGGHYNIKIKHFEDFSGGGLLEPPLMSNRVKLNYDLFKSLTLVAIETLKCKLRYGKIIMK